MPRFARLTDVVRGRGKALVFLGAAAAMAGAGTASAATVGHAAQPTVLSHTAASHAAAFARTGTPAVSLATDAGHTAAPGLGIPAAQAAPQTVPAHPAVTVTPVASHTSTPAAAPSSQPSSSSSSSTASSQPSTPYEIYDSVTPSEIPAGHEIATYADGGYAVSPSQVQGKDVLWIDTNGSDPNASVLDVEPGDATPAQAATWAQQRLTEHPGSLAVIYTMRSDWSAAQAAVSSLPASMQSQIRWWIADPTGVPHIVPGATATQWYWGPDYDISSANGSL